MSSSASGRPRLALPPREDLIPHVLPALVVGFFGTMAWAHRWLHEDGLINLRVVQNLVAGRGPVYNPGERVEAFTSPAQVVLVSLGRIVTFGLVPLEDVVFLVGVGASMLGLWLAMRGAIHLWGCDHPGRVVVPVGAVAFVAVPLTWDFATSGHEGSVGYLWVGTCAWLLGRRVRELRVDLSPPIDRPRWALAVLGSGALVRPELVLYSLAFGAAWWWIHRGAAGSRWRALGWALGPTLAYQVFRMGYYGLVLPNTALAKLGGPLGASEGLHFLASFINPFFLWIPVALLAAMLVVLLTEADGHQRAVVAALIVPAVVNVAYLVSIGGDYVNGRLLVVPLLCLLAPVAVIDLDRFVLADARRPLFVGATAVLLVWASGSATTMRPPWNVSSSNFLDSKFDAREIAVRKWAKGGPPTRIANYRDSFLAGPYKALLTQYPSAGGDVLVVDDPFQGQVVVLPEGEGPVIASTTIGALGTVSGMDVRIIDRLALADPVASHLPPTGTTAGHMRKLPVPWVYGRMGIAADPDSQAAIDAMACGDLEQLLEDTTGPMTPKRFLTNLFHAPANTRVQVPSDPQEARDAFC